MDRGRISIDVGSSRTAGGGRGLGRTARFATGQASASDRATVLLRFGQLADGRFLDLGIRSRDAGDEFACWSYRRMRQIALQGVWTNARVRPSRSVKQSVSTRSVAEVHRGEGRHRKYQGRQSRCGRRDRTRGPRSRDLAALRPSSSQREEKLAEAALARADVLRQRRELDVARSELELTVEKRIRSSSVSLHGRRATKRLALGSPIAMARSPQHGVHDRRSEASGRTGIPTPSGRDARGRTEKGAPGQIPGGLGRSGFASATRAPT